MPKNGTSINDIALMLKREKVLIPSIYAQRKDFKNPTLKPTRGEYLWDTSMVRKILMNQLYVGDVINFRTYSKSCKLKARLDNPPENWEVHRDVHDPIIYTHDNPDNHYLSCRNSRARKGTRVLYGCSLWHQLHYLIQCDAPIDSVAFSALRPHITTCVNRGRVYIFYCRQE